MCSKKRLKALRDLKETDSLRDRLKQLTKILGLTNLHQLIACTIPSTHVSFSNYYNRYLFLLASCNIHSHPVVTPSRQMPKSAQFQKTASDQLFTE